MKKCSRCDSEKSIKDFYRDGPRYRSECIQCSKLYKKSFYENNKETILEDRKKYYKENKESIEKRKKKYREQNIEKVKAQERRSYWKHREANLARSKQYHEDRKANHLYKVECSDGHYYIGSTINSINHRKSGHFYDNTSLARHIKENALNKEDLKYSVVKEFQDPEEMKIAERELIKKSYNDPLLLNKRIPNRETVDVEKYPDRWCTKCRIEKPIEEFHYVKSRSTYYPSCKQCCAEKAKIWRASNKESIAKRQKKYYRENREFLLEYNKRYRARKKKLDKQKI